MRNFQRRSAALALLNLVLFCFPRIVCAATNAPGLAVTFSPENGGPAADTVVLPNFALHVAGTDSPTPWLPPGQFTAAWEGFITIDLRSDYYFSADSSGSLKLEINDAIVFDEARKSGNSVERKLSKAIRLNKGANRLKATFTGPLTGDATLRIGWTEKGTDTSPIPPAALTHSDSALLQQSSPVALGRELFIEHRCARCHLGGGAVDLEPDAPALDQLDRKQDWLARWIQSPGTLRADARMPKMFHDERALDSATAIAAYLAQQATPSMSVSFPLRTGPADDKPLFERLHCTACHDLEPGAKPPRISLDHVARKFPTNALVTFLLDPATNYHSIGMPNFKLSADEAAELALYLLKSSPEEPSPSERKDYARGEQLVKTSGCLNCHGSRLENKYSAPKLSSLAWDRGCLAVTHESTSRSPNFNFDDVERAALQAFARTDRSALGRHAPTEFALRQTRLLNCGACHGPLDGLPPLDILGGKLNARWMGSFISGEIPYKPRAERHPGGEPWMEARMPAFKYHGASLAKGLAALHGYPAAPAAESPVDAKLADHGRKLVGKDGGFSCISCHGVRSLKAMEVFDAEGINLQWSAERLLPDYYRRWMRNPLAIDPQTKMPVYFEDGQSPLIEVLEGDAEKQIDAIWQYLRQRDMPLPATQPMQ